MPYATAYFRLALLVNHVGKNSPPDCFLPLRSLLVRIHNYKYPYRKIKHPHKWVFYFWRRVRDSNPRSLSGHSISSAAPSTTRTTLRIHFCLYRITFALALVNRILFRRFALPLILLLVISTIPQSCLRQSSSLCTREPDPRYLFDSKKSSGVGGCDFPCLFGSDSAKLGNLFKDVFYHT